MKDLPPVCICGHPMRAHGLAPIYKGPVMRPCRAAITERHQHGDTTYPCHCRNYQEDYAPTVAESIAKQDLHCPLCDKSFFWVGPEPLPKVCALCIRDRMKGAIVGPNGEVWG